MFYEGGENVVSRIFYPSFQPRWNLCFVCLHLPHLEPVGTYHLSTKKNLVENL